MAKQGFMFSHASSRGASSTAVRDSEEQGLGKPDPERKQMIKRSKTMNKQANKQRHEGLGAHSCAAGSQNEDPRSLANEDSADEVYTTINASAGAQSSDHTEDPDRERQCDTYTYGMTQFGQLGIGYTNKRSTPLP